MFDTTQATPVVLPTPALLQVQQELEALAAVDPVELPGAQALADTRALLAVRGQVDARVTAKVRAAAGARGFP